MCSCEELSRRIESLETRVIALERGLCGVDLPAYLYGADLRYQGKLDAAKAIRAGIPIFIVKWGEGDTQVSTFRQYTEEVIRSDGLLSWYHYATIGSKSGGGYPGGKYDPAIDGHNEASAFLQAIEPYRSPDLPLMLDLEDTNKPTSHQDARVWMRAFVGDVIKRSPKGQLLLYSSERKLREILGECKDDPDFWDWLVGVSELLVPRYGANRPGTTKPDWDSAPPIPEPWADWVGWQFTSKYSSPNDGIEKEADMSIFRTEWVLKFVDESSLNKMVASW